MNNRMYLNPATQANLELLRSRGVTVIGPGEGELASHGEQGIGRLAEPAELLEACEALLTPTGREVPPTLGSSLAGVRVLVTAGGTREPIDSVRYIGNRSSGRMGFALAREAARRGAEVTLIAANVALDPPAGVRVIEVQTAAELADSCRTELRRLRRAADERRGRRLPPRRPVDRKLKKDRGPQARARADRGRPQRARRARRRADQLLVGFAAEHGDGAVELGRGKLERKRLDAIVVNDISRAGIGFDAADNEVTIVTADGVRAARAAREEGTGRARRPR